MSFGDFAVLSPARYRAHLATSQQAIRSGLANPALDEGHRDELRAIVAMLERMDGSWAAVEDRCEGAPAVLVHGDLVAKNIQMDDADQAPVVLRLDWETAGWGVPATDLSTSSNAKVAVNVDLRSYFTRVRHLYRGWDDSSFERLSAVGTLFRALAAMDWSSRRLAYEWVSRPMRDLPVFAQAVELSAHRAGITGISGGRR